MILGLILLGVEFGGFLKMLCAALAFVIVIKVSRGVYKAVKRSNRL